MPQLPVSTPPAPLTARSFPIATVLGWSFSTLIVLAIIITGLLSLRAGIKSSQHLLADRSALVVRAITDHSRRLLQPAADQVAVIANAYERGEFDLTDRAAVVTYMRASMAAATQVHSLAWFDTELAGAVVSRSEDGLAERWMTFAFGDQRESVRRTLRRAEEPYWAEIVHIPARADG
jgi:hypothetical protein